MTFTLAHIFRHPIKAHGFEEMAKAILRPGECLPDDRRWAVAHEAAKLREGWNPCANFHRGAKAPALMAIRAQLSGDTITLSHPECADIQFRPDDEDDLPRFLAWLAPLSPEGRAQPQRIVSAGRGMTDSAFPSVAILSLASLRALSQRAGQALSPHRFRGNLWLEGTAPLEEFDWIGRNIRIGGAVLCVKERITRCKATSANPETGRIDADTLGILQDSYGHQDFGVYAEVTNGGIVALNDKAELI
jgi:uncharacterized protein YcbX